MLKDPKDLKVIVRKDVMTIGRVVATGLNVRKAKDQSLKSRKDRKVSSHRPRKEMKECSNSLTKQISIAENAEFAEVKQ
jgi:hypothetical protein